MSDVVTFDEASHSYAINGTPVPSVTQCLEPLYDFRFVSEDDLEKAAEMGRKAHKTVQLYEGGRLDEEKLHPILAGYLKAWTQAKQFFGIKNVRSEVVVRSVRYGYAGTADILCDLEATDVAAEAQLLLDLKTGSKYPAHVLQTAGYKLAAVEEGLLGANAKRASLYLYDNGDFDWDWHTNAMDEPTFLALLTVNKWKQRNNIKTEKRR